MTPQHGRPDQTMLTIRSSKTPNGTEFQHGLSAATQIPTLDPLIAALAQAVDRQNRTAG